ncbi:MAG: hypothetical protein RIS94_2412 [Pseudomonadota bacterium]
MAIVRAIQSFDQRYAYLASGVTLPAPVLEAGAYRVEPYADSYTLGAVDGQGLGTVTYFAGDDLSATDTHAITEIANHAFRSGGWDNEFRSDQLVWSIEGVSLSRAQIDTMVVAANGGDATAFETMLREELTGDDVFYLGSGGDRINAYEGNDVIYAGGGSDAIYAGAGNDLIDGRSNLIDDYHMASAYYVGGTGNDTYILGSVVANVVEATGEGTDLVKIADPNPGRKYIAPAGVENIWLINTADTAVTGNGLANDIRGNAAANTLYGAGGADVLRGLGGTDILNGGAGADVLYGGAGLDRLTGGAGTDRFVFDTAPNTATNADTITDFFHGTDKLAFAAKVFAGIGAVGPLASAAFWSGANVASAHDASDRVIYDTVSGKLYFDADGTGSAGAVLVATLGVDTHPALTAVDSLIVA